MNQEHPITPPPELVQQWLGNYFGCVVNGELSDLEKYLATQAARWGADQELGACCALMDDWGLDGEDLMECRRPKPPSLKEQALDALAHIATGPNATAFLACQDTIRRALEQLP